MGSRGFSLIELMVVVAISATLMSLAVLQFNRMSRKAAVESQVTELHSDLVAARNVALFGKRGSVVSLTANRFAVYSTMTLTGAPVRTKTLKYPVTLAVESPNAATGTLNIFFDASGMAGFSTGSDPDSSLYAGTICAGDANSPAAVDSLVVGATMATLGKNNSTGCNSANISAK